MHSDLKRFIAGDFGAQTEVLTRDDEMAEFMFLGLRLTEGVSKQEFKKIFGCDMETVYGEQLKKLESEGLMTVGERVFLTDKGMDVANYCMSEFIR